MGREKWLILPRLENEFRGSLHARKQAGGGVEQDPAAEIVLRMHHQHGALDVTGGKYPHQPPALFQLAIELFGNHLGGALQNDDVIRGMGRIAREPVMSGDQVVARDRMGLSLTFDHRIIDGAPAARFLQTLTRLIENPGPWLIS